MNVKDIDPEIPFKRFGEFFDTPFFKANDVCLACDEAIITLKQLLGTKFITGKKRNKLMSECYTREQ